MQFIYNVVNNIGDKSEKLQRSVRLIYVGGWGTDDPLPVKTIFISEQAQA